eukprot:gene10356-13912_t
MKFCLLLTSVSIKILFAQDIPTIWTQSNSPMIPYSSIASATGGSSLFAATVGSYNIGQVWLSSTNNPLSWSNTTSPTNLESWVTVAMSQDGKYVVAGSDIYTPDAFGNIFLSSDYGESWVETDASTNQAYSSVAIDTTGQFIYGVSNTCCNGGNVYYSHNYGLSFTQVESMDNQPWSSTVCSNNGTYVAVVLSSSNGAIYLSENHGVSFVKSSAPTEQYNVVAGNGDFQFLCAVTAEGTMYCSQNRGISWFRTHSHFYGESSYFAGIAMSSNGSIMYATTYGSAVYSLNHGMNWTALPNSPAEVCLHVAVDSSGTTVALICYPYSTTSQNNTIWIGTVASLPVSVKPSSSPTILPISPSSADNYDNDSLSGGQVAGIVIGTIGGIALIIIILNVFLGLSLMSYMKHAFLGFFSDDNNPNMPTGDSTPSVTGNNRELDPTTIEVVVSPMVL